MANGSVGVHAFTSAGATLEDGGGGGKGQRAGLAFELVALELVAWL